MDRLGLFLFYDSEGIVDDYVTYMLEDMMKNLSHLCILVNGELTSQGRKAFEKFTDHILVRSNRGFDVGAWKDAMIDEFGFEKLEEYDEVILFNDSFFGPIYPFKEMFDEMDERDLDFWAMTVHGAAPDPRDLCPYPHRPRYLQLFFLVMRKGFVKSNDFKDYWQNMPYYEDFNDVGYKHQAVFTKHFEDLGYKWAAFSDTTELEETVEKSLSFHTYDMYDMIKNRKLPVVKRKAFKLPRRSHLIFNSSMDIASTMDYVKSNTDYDMSLIYKYFLRTVSPYEFSTILNAKEIIPKVNFNNDYETDKNIVLLLQMNYIEMSEYICGYLKNVPDYVDIIVTTDTEDKKQFIEENCLSKLNNHTQVILVDFSHDLSCLFIVCKDIVKDYDYLCFMNDKRPDIYDYLTIRNAFRDYLWENMLASPDYISSIIKEFDEDESLGLMVPPTANYGEYFGQYAKRYWDSSFQDVENLFIRMNLHTVLNPEDFPLSMGNCFWAKVDALKPIFDLDLTHDDFFKKTESDNSFDHALERIYPYVAASQRYYTKNVMTPDYARNELGNYQYMLNETVSLVNERSGDLVNVNKNFNVFLSTLRKSLINKYKFNQVKKVDVIEHSTSWKITKPFRMVTDTFRKLRK